MSVTDDMKKERDYFAEQSKVAQKLVGTYRAECEALREKLAEAEISLSMLADATYWSKDNTLRKQAEAAEARLKEVETRAERLRAALNIIIQTAHDVIGPEWKENLPELGGRDTGEQGGES